MRSERISALFTLIQLPFLNIGHISHTQPCAPRQGSAYDSVFQDQREHCLLFVGSEDPSSNNNEGTEQLKCGIRLVVNSLLIFSRRVKEALKYALKEQKMTSG